MTTVRMDAAGDTGFTSSTDADFTNRDRAEIQEKPAVTALITTPPAVTYSLAELATRIEAAHRATEAAVNSALASAIAAGEMLAEAKAQLPHGEWLPWLEQNTSVPARTASLYMRLAKHRVEIGNGVADLTVRAATATLAASKRSIAAPASKAKTPPPRGEPKPTDCERLAGAAKTGEQVNAVTAFSACDPKASKTSDGIGKEAEPAPALHPQAWSMSTAQEREAFVKAVGRSEIEDAFHAIESGYASTRGLNALNQSWNGATESDRRAFYRRLFPANVRNPFQT
jgi:hypothetical protein